MYALVQQLGNQSLPDSDLYLPSLVEDEHSIRLLVMTELVPTSAWLAAVSGGAQGVLSVTETGARYVPAPYFAEHKVDNKFGQAYELADRHWMRAEWGASYPTLQLAWESRARSDNPFVHLHTHTEASALDGYSTMAEIGQAVLADKQQAIAVTDHSVCAGHPALQQMTAEFGLHPVFGIEANFVEDRFRRENPGDYWHLVLWAENDEGLRNLWALSTEGYRDGFYGRPRIDWDTLSRLSPGLIVSTACLRGPVLQPYLAGDEQRATANLMRLGDLFGDRLCIELHANHLDDQIRANHWLIELAGKTGVPLLAAVDSHYAFAEQKRDHQVWLAMQTNSDVAEDGDLFAGGQDYHLMSLDEVRSALSYLPDDVAEKAIAATGELAARCTAEVKPKIAQPVFSRPTAEHPDAVAHDVQRFVDGALANWDERVTRRVPVEQQGPYLAQFEREAPMLIRKGFSGYFLITADIVNWAKQNGILVGPGRGSGGASLLAYLHRITELDPIEGRLMFDRFMTEGRKSLPDFDLDFPSSRTDDVIAYVQQRWGHEHVARVGSHMRIKNRSAFKDVQRAIASELPEQSYVWTTAITKLIEQAEASTAGLGLSWGELMDQVGEQFDVFRERMPKLFEYAEKFHLRLKTYGKHAAGIIIDPDADLEAELPMRLGDTADSPMVTQFDMEALEYLGKVKFDFLSLRNLDTIQLTIDAVERDTGRRINPYEWSEEYADPQVFEQLAEGWTLGVFQIETPLGTRVARQLKPQNRNDLMNIITIGRPGPLRSGLDKLYLRRRDGLEPVSYPDPRLEQVLADTYGVMLFQEDIMGICRVLAGYTSDEADTVRKILGKKKIELVETEGRKFIQRAVQNGTDRAVAESLWAQMAEYAKYSFNKAHAYAYATIGCWTAWPKTHYPRQSLTAAMATIKKERIPAFVAEARRLGYQVLPPDINISQRGFSAHELEIRYGLESVGGIGEQAALAVIQGQPYTSYEDFLARKGGAANMGVVKKLVAIGAFDSLHPNRRALEARVIDQTSGAAEECIHLDREYRNPVNGLGCRFDWDSEPKRYGRPNAKGERKLLKMQPTPAKRCSKACRQYQQRPQPDYEHLPDYTAEQIREREVTTLGVFLTSSPFDAAIAKLTEPMRESLYTADDLVVAENGKYMVLAMVRSTRPDPRGREFGFASLLTPSGELPVILYSQEWAAFRSQLKRGTMLFGDVIKSADDRYRLATVYPFDLSAVDN